MTLHADALDVLRGWRAPDPAEEALRRRYVAHLESTPDGMRRSSYPDHLTAGTLVIDATGERVLLNLHRKAGRWFHFGGHCEDDDATLAAVALREAHEESGLRELAFHPEPVQLDLHTVPFCGDRGEVAHLDVRYVAAAPADAVAVVSDESLAVRWWPVDDLPELEPAMHALIARARAILV
ncbi:NUDIX hydrolase [Nocardioides nitrophenolicus]|uniref:NUDIX hydrolase n=1 Tax=Nocardioides nitrophenolicus TaxID=60489 RepID=UPI00195E7BF7|nr:NUDIX domain-containing protein [Nocardioides nitrophenolicus]MBM7515723.1 8-oxo-dGTP pyrophosphatase MutT (NUDIX family) [Nocardioides nitrophenolicus]